MTSGIVELTNTSKCPGFTAYNVIVSILGFVVLDADTFMEDGYTLTMSLCCVRIFKVKSSLNTPLEINVCI